MSARESEARVPRGGLETAWRPARARAVLASLPTAVLVLEADGRVSEANPAAEQLLGASAAGLAAGGLPALLGPFSALIALAEEARRRGQPVSGRGLTLTLPPKGSERIVDVQAAPLEGRSEAVVLSVTERTIVDRLDSQFQQRAAGRAAARLAATLAHEVRNPLSGIRGAAQLLERDASDGDAALARVIRDEVDRINGLIDRVEAFGDTGALDLAPVNVHEVLDHVGTLAANGVARRVEITRRFDPSLPTVAGNRHALIQVFLNLVKNGAESCGERGGRLRLSTAYHHGLSHRARDGRGRIQLPIAVTVSDNGPGIPEDARAHLFDPFFTTKNGGSGLGLALVAKLVNDHGGAVEAETAGGWTHFRVFLAADGARESCE